MRQVFIVGLPRTGTKLVRNILNNAHEPRCAISPEIWFFGDRFRAGLRRILRKHGDMRENKNIHEFVQYLYSGRFRRTYCILLNKGKLNIEACTLEHDLLETDRSDRAIYLALMDAFARADGASEHAGGYVVGDKTPGHLYHVPTLLEWFPEAKVIHTFRDPRAIMASEWKRLVKEGKPGSLGRLITATRTLIVVLYVTVTWLYAVRLHHLYSRRYPDNYYLSKYEDVVTDPETSVTRLCAFLDIKPEPGMMHPAKVGSSFASRSGSGFDRGAIDRWRDHLRPWMVGWLSFWAGRYLEEFGYRR